MTDFTHQDLGGARFENVDLTSARFEHVDLTRAHIEMADLTGLRARSVVLCDVKISGAELVDVDIDAYVENVRINGVDVVPLIDAELNRRDPDRATWQAAFSGGADAFREAWAVVERRWPETVERARRLPADRLHERIDGEWSVIENLRHLVFATDAWVKRTVLGEDAPFDALGLPHTEMGDQPGVPNDPDARPTLDDVLVLRADRLATVRSLMADLTDEVLEGTTEPNPAPGYPAPDAYSVRRCLGAVLGEEWAHRGYIERDLAVLEARS
jgi:hypothetical protein